MKLQKLTEERTTRKKGAGRWEGHTERLPTKVTFGNGYSASKKRPCGVMRGALPCGPHTVCPWSCSHGVHLAVTERVAHRPASLHRTHWPSSDWEATDMKGAQGSRGLRGGGPHLKWEVRLGFGRLPLPNHSRLGGRAGVSGVSVPGAAVTNYRIRRTHVYCSPAAQAPSPKPRSATLPPKALRGALLASSSSWKEARLSSAGGNMIPISASVFMWHSLWVHIIVPLCV